MLKRNDLVKQFESVVQQEIKNHNDQMLATNLSINLLSKELNIVAECLDHYEKTKQSQIQKLTSSLESKCLSDDIRFKKVDSRLNDMGKSFDDVLKHVNGIREDLVRNIELVKIVHSELDLLGSQIKKIMCDLERASVEYQCALVSQNLNLLGYIQETKQEILNLPSEAQQIKKELESKMSSAIVDFEGLMREISIIKKSIFISEKKFENIYTLIERLNKDKSCHKLD